MAKDKLKAAERAAKKAAKAVRSSDEGLPLKWIGVGVVIIAALLGLVSLKGNKTNPDFVIPSSSPGPAEKTVVKDEAVPDVRVVAATKLLETLEEGGATVFVPFEAKVTKKSGLALFTTEAVKQGETLFSIPSNLMIGNSKDELGLTAALLREHFKPSSESNKLYIDSLPDICPPNVVTWGDTKNKLISATIHKWKVDMVKSGRKLLTKEFPQATKDERDWAICMVLSRSITMASTENTMMMPVIDLLNHSPNPNVYMASPSDKMEIVAARDLEAGEELTWEYLASPSRVRLLTSFGFAEGPAASLAAKALPQRDQQWLEEQGCAAVPRTDLVLDEKGMPSAELVRDSIRCIRLRLYTPEQAEWALANNHLEAAWDGAVVTKDDGILYDVLKHDLIIISNTGQLCHSTLPQDPKETEHLHELIRAGSTPIHAAVRDEITALMGCAHELKKAYQAIQKRLQP